ncbi:MAG: YihY/virulence factor BrkB family protein [Mogibacterium sp.]|nr:YihY/virulence factor BrkB family protein [Mogibacterium sp.]
MEKWKNSRAGKILRRTAEIYTDNALMVYAGNATLFLITALFPFMMLIILVINLIPSYSPEDVTELLFRILPDLESIRSFVQNMMINLKQQSSGLLASVAVVTTLWSASAGVGAIQKGLTQLDPLEKGNVVRDMASRLFYTVLLILLIPAILMFQVLRDSIIRLVFTVLERLGLESASEIEARLTSILQISSLLLIVAVILVILMLYTYLPRGRKKLKSQLPGTIFTAVGWYVFTELFAFFIPRFYRSSQLYGSLASLFLALLWLRFIVMILFGGAAVNKALEEQGPEEGKRYAERARPFRKKQ